MIERTWVKRGLTLVVLGAASGAVVACVDDATKMMGEMVKDAGHMLSDAGAALSDAGDSVKDAGKQLGNDARAQDSCDSCTPTGAKRVVVASEDSRQFVGGFLFGQRWTITQDMITPPLGQPTNSYIETALLGDGPLVVTDLQALSGTVSLFAVPKGSPCFEANYDDAKALTGYSTPANARLLYSGGVGQVHGARFSAKADESMCAYGGGGLGTADRPAELVWTGFRPYE